MLQKTTFKFDSSSGPSTYGGFNFGCAVEPEDGKIKLLNGAHTCREGLFYNMRSRIRNSSSGGTAQPTDKMRMIFRWYTSQNISKTEMGNNNAWMMRSISVLQAFDRLAGWPLTRVYKLDVGNNNSWLQAYYYHSSRRWMKSSYLVSLYILLVRMCKDERITGFKDFNGLVKVVNAALNSGKSLVVDNNYVKSSLPYWEAIMVGYPKLFRKRKLPYYWDTGRLEGGGTGGAEGVQYLVKGDTKYTEIREELLKIKKQLDAKK